MRRLLAEDVLETPLLPQPGNIWADVLPDQQPGPSEPAPHHQGTASPAIVATLSRVSVPAGASAGSRLPVVHAPPPPGMARQPPVDHGPVEHGQVEHGPVDHGPVDHGPVDHGQNERVGHPLVQLTAASSGPDAVAAWRRLRRSARALTDGHEPAVIQAEVKGREVWRLRAGGFATMADATAFCAGIRAIKAGCWVVPAAREP